jgi:hypothetical protein
MVVELEASKSYQMLYVEIIKVLSLNRENRNVDSQAFLDKCISEYQKLFDASCILENNIKDELIKIHDDEPLEWRPSRDDLDVERNGEII